MNERGGGFASFSLVVGGPTASGKSALAVQLAIDFQGEVVNGDSVQAVCGADIGSAKITSTEMRGVPHHLLDLVSPTEPWDAGSFSRAAHQVREQILARGKRPVFVVPAGMYLTALVQGLAALPPRNEKLREQLDREDLSTLFQRLQQSDPLSASRIHPNDRIRITRALETIQQTGVPHGEHQGSHQFREVALPALMIVLVWERDELQRRIALRTSQMVRDGLLAEARTILNQYGPDAQLFRSIGYREASQVLRGELPEERLAEAVVVATRQLAKRQMTFWRNEPVKRGWKVAPIEGAQGTTTVGAVLDEGATKRARLNARGTTVFRWSFDELRQRIFDFQPHDTPEVWFLDGEAISTSLRFCVAGT